MIELDLLRPARRDVWLGDQAGASDWQRIAPTPQAGKRDYISYSAVSLYQGCPLRYYFRYVAGLPEEFVSASLLFGSALHASVQFHFEQLLAGQPAPHRDALLEIFQERWQQTDSNGIRFAKGENRDTLGSLADRMLRVFQDSAHSRPQGAILGVEEELRGPDVAGCSDLLARLDLIVDVGDAVVISDFKTSGSAWSEARVTEAASQLLLYHELAGGLGEGKPIRLEFAVLTKTKSPALSLHPVAADRRQIARTKRVVARVWRAIQAGHFYPAPSLMQCPGCPYQRACQNWTG
jgi:CRISPR/Cas system-associated exonuclease Cas4 (RecB family)